MDNLESAWAAPRLSILRLVQFPKRLLPPINHQEPVIYTKRLLAFILATAIATVFAGWLAISLTPKPYDWPTILLAAGFVLAMSIYSVSSFDEIDSNWSPSEFVGLGSALALGPMGAFITAIAAGAGPSIRRSDKVIKTVFNTSTTFLTLLSAWLVFSRLTKLSQQELSLRIVGVGLLCGVIYFMVNNLLIACVVRINTGVPIVTFLRGCRNELPYCIGFGWGATGFVILHHYAGTLGFTTALVPVLLLQGYLIYLAHRIHAQNQERARHQQEREALFQRAIVASDNERQRIAGELHDGVVQNLLGLTLQMDVALRTQKTAENGNNNQQKMTELLQESTHITRTAMSDLRTLMIEIAPPKLNAEGLKAALKELLSKLERNNVKVHFECPDNPGLDEEKSKLIYRVTLEGIRNIVKYAQAKNVYLKVSRTDDQIELEIRDDGQGFSEEKRTQRKKEGHVGLTLLEQTALDGGATSLSINSAPGKGATLLMYLPVTQRTNTNRSQNK